MRRPGWPVAAGAGVGAALLVLLGALQVQWLGRVAQTIAAQKRAALHRRAGAVAGALDGELSRAWRWFERGEREGTALEAWLGQRWRGWREAGGHAALLQAVWLAEPGAAGGEPRLRRLGSTGAFEEAAWPQGMRALRDLFHEDVRFTGTVANPDAGRAWLVLLPDGAGPMVLLELDGGYVARALLPALATESTSEELGPVLARLEDVEGRPLFGAAGPAGFRAGEHDPVLVPGMRPELGPPPGMPPPRGLFRRHLPDGRILDFHAGPGAPARLPAPMPPGPTGILTRGPFGFPPGHGPRPRPLAGMGPWRLSLALAAGPVDDVVTSLRRRNLALSFSILALLGGAIAALVLAARRAQALAERQRQFTASISHELRTPLAVIGSAAENLRDGTVDEPERVREYGAMIHAESRRLGALVDHTLRLAAGGALDELRRRPIDLVALVNSAIEAFADETRARGAHVERDYAADLPLVSADAEALRQAVANVVGNALKYGGDQPRVTVRLRAVETAAGPEVQLTVEDQGMGIPRDEVLHVFEPFFRGREAIDRQIRGTGLGLAIVARVMRAHGGDVSVESTPGAGSVFLLRLPAEATA